jgi:succinate dehydrogenase hydrophobic anchor subunit
VRADIVGSKRVRTKPRVQEAAMTSGLILLILIGALVAFAYTRLRGKMKLSVSGKNWIAPIVIVVIVALMLWASHAGSGH